MKRSVWSVLIWLICLCTSVFSASDLTFTRLSFESGTITGIAIVNPNGQEATVTLTAIGADGIALSGNGIRNPVQIKIPAGQQYAQVTSTIFGGAFPADTTAWIRATSSSDNLTGFFLYLNPTVSFLDGADLPALSSDLLFLQLRSDSQYSTEINLVNPSPDTKAAVHLALHVGTNVPSFADVILPPSGALRFDFASVFGSGALTGAAYLSVGSTTPLAGFEFVRGPGDLLGLNAIPVAPGTKTIYFPQMAVLDPFRTELVIVNTGDSATVLTLKAHQIDGELYGPSDLVNNPVTQPLQAHGIVRLDVAQLFGFHGSSYKEGWMEVESSSTEIAATAGYLVPGSNSYASVAGSAQGRTRALFSHLATSFPFFTGVALLNSGSLTANVRIVAEKQDGTFLGAYTTSLRPGQRLSKLVHELIKASANQAGGLVWVSSDVPIHAISLFGSSQTFALANIPPQPVPSSFVPGGTANQLRISPRLAVLLANGQQAFAASGVAGAVQWKVNGVAGGSAALGRIPNGLYQAPSTIPNPIPVTITATVADQTAGASVDLLRKETVIGGLGVVSSVAYLASLQRLYTAELSGQGVSNSSGVAIQAGVSSSILNVTGGVRTLVRDFAGEEIPKMVPFTTSTGHEVLLLVGKTTGRIIRLDPTNGPGPVDVATGLSSPTAAVVDPVSGGLLVAEANQVTLIPSSQLNQGLAGARIRPATLLDPTSAQKLADRGGSGIAVDPCDGSIFLSDPSTGSIVSVDRTDGSSAVVVDGLANPGQLLGAQRTGVSCPDSFHLFVAEQAADQVSLVIPASGDLIPWLDAPGIRDIAAETDAQTGAISGFYLAQAATSAGSIVRISEPGVYDSGAQVVSTAPVAPQPGTFTHYLDFIAALGTNPDILTESFDDIAAGTIIDSGTTINGITYVSFPPGTKGLVSPPYLDDQGNVVLNPQGKPYGKYNAIGDDFLALSRPGPDSALDYFLSGESMTIRFPRPVRAFGLFFNAQTSPVETGYLFLQQGETVVTTGNSQYDFFNVPGDSSFGLFFAGIISDTPFTEVTIGDTSQGDSSQDLPPLGMIVDHFMRVE